MEMIMNLFIFSIMKMMAQTQGIELKIICPK